MLQSPQQVRYYDAKTGKYYTQADIDAWRARVAASAASSAGQATTQASGQQINPLVQKGVNYAANYAGREAGEYVADQIFGGQVSEATKAAATKIGEEAAAKAVEEYGANASAQTVEAGASSAADAAGQAAVEQGLSAADIAQYAAWAYSAYKIYKGWKNSKATDEEKARQTAKQVGLMVADYYIMAFTGVPGVATAAYGVIGETKEWQKVEREMEDYDPWAQAIGAGVKVWKGDGDWGDHLSLLTHGMSDVHGNIFGVRMGDKSTEEYKQERLSSVMRHAATNQDRASIYAENELRRKGEGVPDEYSRNGNPLAGRNATWNDTKNIFFDGSQIVDAIAFKDTFRDWDSGYTVEQRNMIAEAAMDHNLLSHDHGDLVVQKGNHETLQKIAEQVKAGTYQPLKTKEQRFGEVQSYLRNLRDTEGYNSAWVDKSFEDVSYQLRLQEAVAAVDKAKLIGTSLPDWANQILTVEHNRRQDQGQPDPNGVIRALTADEQRRYGQIADSSKAGQNRPQPSQEQIKKDGLNILTERSQKETSMNQGWMQAMQAQMQSQGITPTNNLPIYYDGAPPGNYRHPDGMNRVTVTPDGRAVSTLIGTIDPSKAGPMTSPDSLMGAYPGFSSASPQGAYAPAGPQQVSMGGLPYSSISNGWKPPEGTAFPDWKNRMYGQPGQEQALQVLLGNQPPANSMMGKDPSFYPQAQSAPALPQVPTRPVGFDEDPNRPGRYIRRQ